MVECHTVGFLHPRTGVLHLAHVLVGATDERLMYYPDRVAFCGRWVERETPALGELLRDWRSAPAPAPIEFVRVAGLDEARKIMPEAQLCRYCAKWGDRPPAIVTALADPAPTPPRTIEGRKPEGKLMDRGTIMREYGISRAAAEAIMRRIPKIEIEGLKKVYVQRIDVERYIASRVR